MTYRGIAGMEVHLYRWGELKRELRTAGFAIDEIVPLEDVTYQPIHHPWLLPRIRAGGWMVFAAETGVSFIPSGLRPRLWASPV